MSKLCSTLSPLMLSSLVRCANSRCRRRGRVEERFDKETRPGARGELAATSEARGAARRSPPAPGAAAPSRVPRPGPVGQAGRRPGATDTAEARRHALADGLPSDRRARLFHSFILLCTLSQKYRKTHFFYLVLAGRYLSCDF